MTETCAWGTSQGGVRPRTKPGKRRVLARQGWAGEKMTFFGILPQYGISSSSSPK